MRLKNMSVSGFRRNGERGISLLELLLVTGVLATLLSIGTYVISSYSRETVNQLAADQLIRVQHAGEQFVKTNFTQLLDGTTTGNIAAVGSTRVLTVADLAAANLLPIGLSENTAHYQRMRVWLRNDSNATLPAIAVITATESPVGVVGDTGRPYNWIQSTALYGGGRIGIRANNSTVYNTAGFASTGGQWQVSLAELPGYNGPLSGSGTVSMGYLAAYSRLTNEDAFRNDILYRVTVSGHPEYNQMTTDLNMNGFGVTNVGTMTADRVAANSMTLSGPAPYSLSTEANLTLAGNVKLTGDAVVYADNNAGTGDLSIGSDVTLGNGTISAMTLRNGDLAVGTGGLVSPNVSTVTSNSRDLVVNGGLALTSSPSVSTTALQLSGSGTVLRPKTITTGKMITNTVTVANATILQGSGTHSVIDNMRVNGSITSAPSASANSAFFNNLCYQGSSADGIEACP